MFSKFIRYRDWKKFRNRFKYDQDKLVVEVFNMVGACPRCEKDAEVELGETLLKVGMTREQPVSIALCGNCGLIFYEKIDKVKEF